MSLSRFTRHYAFTRLAQISSASKLTKTTCLPKTSQNARFVNPRRGLATESFAPRPSGLLPFLLQRKDGSSRSKAKGALIVSSILSGMLFFRAAGDYLRMQEGLNVVAWNLVQCYRTNLHFPQVDFEDYAQSAEYFRDLSKVVMVQLHGNSVETVYRAFEVIIESEKGSAQTEKAHALFRRTSREMHRLLEKSGELDMTMVETGAEAMKKLLVATVKFAEILAEVQESSQGGNGMAIVLKQDSSSVKGKDKWDEVS
ncbi:hypothetical protein CYLTODRAFT_494896 [Cylindrobasidium torrendii FP15055 ss-10]|uniref:Uncharacterized protein n=1 Tax=Cylindrobasidium torrendii FP15055 ss-10 TaxID=1314674 RepID=A0A0D7AW28_9AGAR|nr:hypothetical protein CYLTODRAFT_494896 [Cylindrobasidium torrendii FP15055 ss-10]